MDQALNIQTSLQPGSRLGIEVLPPTVRTILSPYRCILSIIMIRIHLSGWTNRGEGMLGLERRPSVDLESL
jgi:hypothetical protein